jgi:hypothetical protein
MPNYIKKPEPGRFVRERVVEKIIEKPVEREGLDIDALANAVASAISLNMPKTQVVHVGGEGYVESKDDFDNTKTMNRLADQMLVQRGDSKANFDDLGSVKKTKKDQKDVDDTIDLLKNLND